MFLERRTKMEITTKDDLLSTLEEIMSRLSIVEQATHEEPENEETESEETKEEPKVESVDEIEKLLNS